MVSLTFIGTTQTPFVYAISQTSPALMVVSVVETRNVLSQLFQLHACVKIFLQLVGKFFYRVVARAFGAIIDKVIFFHNLKKFMHIMKASAPRSSKKI